MLVNKREPIDPAIVLFGLYLESFGPLKNLPKIKPPISDDTHPNNKINKTILK